MVWEESTPRPKPPKVVEPIVQEEDNIVRKMPQDGRTVCRRRIPVEPGCRYFASVKLKGAVTNNCGYLFIDWYGKGGRRMNCIHANQEIWKHVGTNGWYTLSTATERLPEDAVAAEVYIEFYRTTLGKMAFDEFTVTRDRQRHTEMMFSSAYRDEQAEGEVRFVVPLIRGRDMDSKRGAGRFVFNGADGKAFSLPAKTGDGCFEVSLDVARLAVGKSEVRAEFLYDGAVRDSCSMKFDRPQRLSSRRVRMDANGMTRVDGRPFFPLGVYVSPRDRQLAWLDRMKGGPFNCVIECAAKGDVLDSICAAGMMAIPKSPHSAAGVRNTYAAIGKHPALLAWYVIDEAQPDRAAVEIPLQKLRREMDPDHPTLAVLSKAENTGPLMGCYDIVARDPYPLSVNRGYPVDFDNQDILDVSFWPGLMRRNGYGIPPVWQVPQAFAWHWFRSWGDPNVDRFPTYGELRSMSWQSIAGGANGVLWYAASAILGRMDKDREEGERCWKILVDVAEEIAAKMPWLISEERPPAVSECPKTIAARAFKKDGCTAVLLANRTSKQTSGCVCLADGAILNVTLDPYGVKWMSEDPR